MHGCDACRRGQVPLGVTRDAGPDEVARQLTQLAQRSFRRTKDRLQEAARIASEAGLGGEMLCQCTADELLTWFKDEGPGDPPVVRSTVDLIRLNLLPGMLERASTVL